MVWSQEIDATNLFLIVSGHWYEFWYPHEKELYLVILPPNPSRLRGNIFALIGLPDLFQSGQTRGKKTLDVLHG